MAEDSQTPLLSATNGDERSSRPPPVWHQIWHDFWKAAHAGLFFSKVNILLVCVPLGIIANAYDWSDVSTFFLNLLAICALASVLSYATDELSAKVGQTVGGLLNASFGNLVELLVSLVPSISSQLFFANHTSMRLGRTKCFKRWRDPCGPVKYGWKRFVRNSSCRKYLQDACSSR